jgi:hypothetical protein
VTLPAASVADGIPLVAQQDGLYAKHHVKVNFVPSTGTNVASLLIANRVDIVDATTTYAVSLAEQGQGVSVIYNTSNYGITVAALIGAKGSTLAGLKAKGSGCRIAATTPGTVLYGWTLQVEHSLGLHCGLSTSANLAQVTASVTNGAADAAAVLVDSGTALVKKGQASMLFDPLTMSVQQRNALVPVTAFPDGIMLGLRANLDSKSVAVERFLGALNDALNVVRSSTPEQLATTLSKVPTFATADLSSMAIAWQSQQSLLPSTTQGAQITQQDWTNVLTGVGGWGLTTVSPSDPKVAYAKIVDMSYLDKAS